MLSVHDVKLTYEPFPIGIVSPVFDDATYAELLANWPDQGIFYQDPKEGGKLKLGEKHNARAYHDFIDRTPVWREFYRYVKSRALFEDVLGTLEQRHIDLGYALRQVNDLRYDSGPLARLRYGLREVGLRLMDKPTLTSDFVFTMMPGQGSFIRPHTDSPGKVTTLVVAMTSAEDWDPDWAGGTAMYRPRQAERTYNYKNETYEFEDCETLHTYPFLPNQCIVFVKTYNSFHGVAPLSAPREGAFRKSINIHIKE